jgi:SPP1 gp7 family putative phage head morphogenesis protein
LSEELSLSISFEPRHIHELAAVRRELAQIHKARRAGIPRAYKVLRVKAQKNMARAAVLWKDKVRKAVLARLARGLPKGSPAEIADKLADWKALEKMGEDIFFPALMEAHSLGYKSVRFKAGGGSIGEMTERSAKWAGKHAGELVKGITEETRYGIRGYISSGIVSGRDLGTLGRELRTIVGVSGKQGESLGKYYSDLLESGMDEGEIMSKVERLAQHMQTDRAMTIARTETAEALSEGTRLSYKEHGIEKLEWVADPTACEEICLPNDGRVYDVDEAEGEIPAHPRCECCWAMAIGEESSE